MAGARVALQQIDEMPGLAEAAGGGEFCRLAVTVRKWEKDGEASTSFCLYFLMLTV